MKLLARLSRRLGLDNSAYEVLCGTKLKPFALENVKLVNDRYRGIHVVLPCSETTAGQVDKRELSKFLEDAICLWRKEKRTAVWLHIPIKFSDFIPSVTHHGFKFHHAEGDYSSLSLWLESGDETRIPISASHQVGVGGCCIDVEQRKLLVVKEKRKSGLGWKIPGGFSKLGENFDLTATREVLEETGVKTKYQSVLGFRQKHDYPGAFGKSDLYVVTRLKPLSFDLRPCPREIQECRWMHIEELLETDDLTPMMKQIVPLLHHGLCTGFDNIDITCPPDEEALHRLRAPRS